MDPFTKALDLKKFLVEKAKDPLLMDKALQATQPLFEAAMTSDLALTKADEADEAMVRAVIAGTLDPSVKRVVFLSAAQPLGPQEWACDIERSKFTLDRLANSIRRNLSGWANYNVNFVEPIVSRTNNGRAFSQALWDGLLNELADALKTVCGQDLGGCLSLGLWYCLYHFLGFAVTGSTDGVATWESLVRLMPGYIPLGRRNDETDTWVVLAA